MGGVSGRVSLFVVFIVLVAIGIVIGGLYIWVTGIQRSESVLQSIELSLEPPAIPTAADRYEIRVGQTASLAIIGVFSNGSRLDASLDPNLAYYLSPCEELDLDEVNKCVTGLLASENPIPMYVKINDVASNTIYVKVVLPTR